MAPIWAWWPQACAAPVSGSACGWPGTMSESSSPMTATVGPAPPPSRKAFTPVTAMPSSQAMPMPRRACAVSAAVSRSRKPVSGVSRMRFATLTALSAFRSISAQTAALSSSIDLVTGASPPSPAVRAGLDRGRFYQRRGSPTASHAPPTLQPSTIHYPPQLRWPWIPHLIGSVGVTDCLRCHGGAAWRGWIPAPAFARAGSSRE